MRVAIITRDYPPAIGGIATHVEGLVKALRRLGVEADLYVGKHDVRTLLLPFDIPLKEYDVVHVQSLPYGAFVCGVPLVVTVHSPVLEEFGHYRKTLKLESVPAIALEKASLSRARAVLAVSGESRAELVSRYGVRHERVQVIGNGVDSERFSGRRDPDAAAARRVLVVSRLEPRKNVREAIEAVAELPEGTCNLEIAGDGSEREALVELAKNIGAGDSVHFLGRVDGASLPEVYARSAIFLTTSESEGFGLSLLEAMACVVRGTLVSTSNGAMPIENIRKGTLVLTHSGRYRPVLQTFVGIRGGVMYVIETSHGRLCITPTHKFLTRSGWMSAESLYFACKSEHAAERVHRRLLRWRESYDNKHSKANEDFEAPRDRAWNPADDRGRSELSASGSSLLDKRKARRPRRAGFTSTRIKIGNRGQTLGRSHLRDIIATADLQEERRDASSGGLQQEVVIRPEYAGGLDLVYRQGDPGANDKFGIQPGAASEGCREAEWIEIGSIEPIQYVGQIFDLSVAADNSYVANGLTVHNSGCACVASDLPTHRGLIEHGVNGMIYTGRAELVSCLRELLSSPHKAERLGDAAREVAMRHTWGKVAEKVAAAYEGVATGKRVGRTLSGAQPSALRNPARRASP